MTMVFGHSTAAQGCCGSNRSGDPLWFLSFRVTVRPRVGYPQGRQALLVAASRGTLSTLPRQTLSPTTLAIRTRVS